MLSGLVCRHRLFKFWGHTARRDLSSPLYLVMQIFSTKWQWTHAGQCRRNLGFWPNPERLVQLAWEAHRQSHQPKDWQAHAQGRQGWIEFTAAWLHDKGLQPLRHYENVHDVDLHGRMLLQTGETFRLLPMRHVPVEPPYPSSLQVLQNEDSVEDLESGSVHTVRFVTDGSCTKGRGGWAVMVAAPYATSDQATVCYGKVPGQSTNLGPRSQPSVMPCS